MSRLPIVDDRRLASDPEASRLEPRGFDTLLAEAGRRSIPLDVSIELTHHCNFRCVHCYIPDFLAPDLLSTDRVLELLDELHAMGTLFLTLTGGELFLRRDWAMIARRARALGFALRLFSNGVLVDDEVADIARELWATVEISLYSMDEEIFETITQRAGSYAKTLDGIERLRARNVPLLLKTPMMRHNAACVRSVRTFAQSIGAQFQASPTIVAKKDGDRTPIDLRITRTELAEHLAATFGGGGPATGCHVDAAAVDPRIDGPQCAAASRYCNITASGDVMACNILPGSGGNLREQSFRDIWQNSPWLRQVRSIRRRDLHTCRDCEHVSYCGRCHAQALVEDGDLYGPSRFAQMQAEILSELDRSREPEEADAATVGRRSPSAP
ncbi:MAG: radical SAM protein [Acidobacteriota bacterium]